MVTKNLALIIVFAVLYIRYIKAIVKKMKSYDNRIISKKSKVLQCSGFVLFCIAITNHYLFKDDGMMLYQIGANIKSFIEEPHVLSLWGWYFIYSVIGNIMLTILMNMIFNLREIKDMEALKTYYFAYDTLQNERKLFNGLENESDMNKHIDKALIELANLLDNKRDYIRISSLRHVIYKMFIQRSQELMLDMKRMEDEQKQYIRRYADEIAKIELPENALDNLKNLTPKQQMM